MTSIFPLLEALQFDTKEFPLELQARLLQGQPEWSNKISTLVAGEVDTQLYQDFTEFFEMIHSTTDWILAGHYLVGFSAYFLHDPEARFNHYPTPEKVAIIQNLANRVCDKNVELYKQLVVAKYNYEKLKTKKMEEVKRRREREEAES